MKLIDSTKQTTDFTKVRAYVDSAGDLVFHPKYGNNNKENRSPWILLRENYGPGTIYPALKDVPDYEGLPWTPENPDNKKLFFLGDQITFELD